MKAVTSQLIGRFGNQLFQYAHARAYAEQHGVPLRVPRWIGEEVFTLSNERPRGDEMVLGHYRQRQEDLIYTRSQVRAWFTFRPEIVSAIAPHLPPDDTLLAHRRVGDYIGYGYPVVSVASYYRACEEYGLDSSALRWVTEESPLTVPTLPDKLAFLPDFYRLTRAITLLRGNSTFSWWAAALGAGRVFSPVITNLPGGREHDCHFVEGNWPRFADLPDTTDLHLAP